MKVGDLIYDDHYGYGVVLKVEDDGATIFFSEYQGSNTCFLDKQLFDSVEVVK